MAAMLQTARVQVGSVEGADEALELALAHATVRRVSAGEIEATLRVRRPTAPVTVFGRRDTRLPGFAAAAAASRAAGFEPLVRATGGRAVAYTDQALVVDLVAADPHAVAQQERRFEELGASMAGLFQEYGVDARVGAVPGEYCPGAHSINARGVVKLVGTAQRVVRDAWLFSFLVVVGDQARIRPVLADVYRHLEQPFDPASVGSLATEVPGLRLDELERRVVAAYAPDGAVSEVDDETLALARELVADHRV